MSTYTAIVCPIYVRPHPNADRLQLGSVMGNQVVVGLDIADGTLGIFFACDGQLSDAFCKHNDLYPKTDEQGRRVGGGFFDPRNRRVRAQRFRGEKSDGFWLPLSCLDGFVPTTTIQVLKNGDQFLSLDGIEICQKYETEATKSAGQQNKAKQPSKKNPLFREHVETKQFKYEMGKIPVGSIVHISEKVHGTSARYGFFAENRPFHPNRVMNFLLFWLQWAVFWLMDPAFKGPPKPRIDTLLVGTRRVQLKGPDSPTSFYGDEEFRYTVAKQLNGALSLGETVYGELVGYTTTGKAIMPSQSNKKLQDKTIVDRYGPTMHFKYGCPEGSSKFYVYRITRTTSDGRTTELSVAQTIARCKQLGLEYVPSLLGPLVVVPSDDGLTRLGLTHPLVTGHATGSLQTLESIVEGMVDGPSTLDPSHIREGIVVRVDTPDGDTYFLKDKNFTFKVLEGIIKDEEGYVDTEESA